MKKLWLYIFIPIALLVACTGQQVLNSVETFKNTDTDKQTNVVYDSITENQFIDIEMDEIRDLINSMEAETPEIKYTDMDQSLLEFYTRPIKNDYKFLGRFANNGYAYILGISKTESAVLRDLDCRVEEIGYVQLGKWIDSRMDNEENFDKIYDFPGILSFYQSKDGKFLYLGIRQYSDLDDIKYSGMNIGKVFNEIVNDNRLEYISQLHEKQLRALKPFKTPYISMYKWEHGEDFYAYKPISYDELTKITDDKSKVEPSKINSECVGLYDYDGEPMPFMDSINQSLYEKIEDFYEVRSLDEIADICFIKYIRKNPQGQQSKIINIKDLDTVDKIIKILKSSDVSYMGGTSYEDLLILIKEDGSEIELQISPYYFGTMTGEGFILGNSVCYSPGTEEWINLMEKYFSE
ncbi:hypothetical protein HMPREF9333_00497 [Johnsonella ignava ATCC 51276]|uniref:Lipoprotein n=1 Tax=Johnsonella ignava ATCC 51276 TaxID=679200 RepID=G5GG08_9FIRM|nr:hypothetical protein [Johnsonella ignava]EHI56218.1 hypothetical protein HMPREF9333_00497 [Johnsonella ignava ATCC 51276]